LSKKVATRENVFGDATRKTRYAMPCLWQRQHAGTKGFQG